jgi:hypothetical protein
MAITPYLLYQDAGAALQWIAKAFGLRKSGASSVWRTRSGRASLVFRRRGLEKTRLGEEGAAKGHSRTQDQKPRREAIVAQVTEQVRPRGVSASGAAWTLAVALM